MPDTPAPEKHEFKAEVAAVLRLVTHSLYTNREIFLRELISNASDALDKARYAALVESDLEGQDLEPSVRITADKDTNVLVIEDNGMGMTPEEARANLGTIAHSGTLRFLEESAKAQSEGKKSDLNLIGQFGVGFYSAFMVAERVDVFTKSARPGHEGVHWSSTGDGSFTIAPTSREHRGTRIEVHLKEDATEYLDSYRIEHIVRRYSNFVMYPVQLQEPAAKPEGDAAKDAAKDDATAEPTWRQLNEIGAFWTRSASDLEDEDYQDFYKHVMGGFVMPGAEPLGRLHLAMDAPIQFHAVLFIPGHRPADLFNEDSQHLQLFARRVMVMENCDKLLPSYLRFMRGVVDSEDLPLNVSREMLQENKNLSAIRRQLTRKTLRLLSDTAKEDRERYEKVFEAFGVFLKEGLHTDNGHREELTDLLRFSSTGHEAKWISLREYVDTMPEGQESIYYITGRSAQELRNSPHIEACRAKGYAVLLMTDSVDEWVVQDLAEYDGKPMVSVTKADLDLDAKPAKDGDDSKAPDAKEDASEDAGELAPLLARAKEVLGTRVSDVKLSRRLTSSASCLVDDGNAMGHNMERILRQAGREIQARPRILEINGGHKFVKAAAGLATEAGENTGKLDAWIELLHDQAHLAEGEVPDPVGVVGRIQAVLDALVD